jgi:mono/diheme cytochrome c family protein
MNQLKRNIPLYIILLLTMLVAACAPAPTPTPEPTAVPATPTPIELPTAVPPTEPPIATTAPTTAPAPKASGEVSGASLFQLSCASCHGADAAGVTFTKEDQSISTPSLNWAELTKTYSADPSRGTVADQVALSMVKGLDETGGDLNTMMPRWSDLSKSQVDSLVQFIQTVVIGSPAPTALSPEASALQGEQLYKAACAACHGKDGAGITFTKEDHSITTPSLSWAELTKTYSADPSRGSVADQVALSMVKGQDETGGDLNTMMPRWTLLSKAQVDSLVQYLQTTFK